MGFDVFISYPHQDKATADAACAKLEAQGIRCWIAPRDIPPGAEWAGAIIDAIDQCRAMVLIFSSSANRSKQIRREVQQAFDGEKPVVPFRIENVAPDKSLRCYMGAVHWLDALTPPLEQHLQKLVVSVQALVQATTSDGNREERFLQEAEAQRRAAEAQHRQEVESRHRAEDEERDKRSKAGEQAEEEERQQEEERRRKIADEAKRQRLEGEVTAARAADEDARQDSRRDADGATLSQYWAIIVGSGILAVFSAVGFYGGLIHSQGGLWLLVAFVAFLFFATLFIAALCRVVLVKQRRKRMGR
jgi:TIR domain